LFKPYERAGAASQPSPEPTPDVVAGPVKKQVPTPTRKQAEEARRQRLHPTPTKKEARALDRQARNSRRDEQLQKVEGQPGKVLLRDHRLPQGHLGLGDADPDGVADDQPGGGELR